MKIRYLLLVVLSIVCSLAGAAEQPGAERRIALVIGNAAYKATSPLTNPVNDARDMAAALRKLGFDVIEKTDATQKEMNRAIGQFGEKLRSDSIAMFFYAGHGMQVKGKNYLIPVDAEIKSEASVPTETVDVDAVMAQIAVSRLNIVVLDACRNNPFERSFRAVGGGLAQMDAPKGSLIAYATAPGKTAADGTGRNGLYTQELLKNIQAPGVSLESVFKQVRIGVMKASGDNQMPWESSSLTGDFFFKGGQATAATGSQGAASPQMVASVDASVVELEYWRGAQQANSADAYQSYLAKYPKGMYAELATANLNKMRAAKAGSVGGGGGDGVELVLWESVNSSGDASEYQEYLRQFPNGRFAVIAKNRIKALGAKTPAGGGAKGADNVGSVYSRALQGDGSALNQLKRIAEQGNPDGQAKLAFMYEFGRAGLSVDAGEAAKWYRRAAEQGFARAQAGLGAMYASGRGGLARDEAEALKWFRKAAEQGDDRGQNALGTMYMAGKGGLPKDEAEALKWFRKSAEQGSEFGQNSLGLMYARGLGGLAQNDAEAVRWYRSAAEQGHPGAQNNLGIMYINGRGGLPKDEYEALKWYRKAAEQGYGHAQGNLGLMYLNGRAGLPKDEVEAAKWFRLAADQGVEGAQASIGLMYEQGRGGMPRDAGEARQWYRKAAEQGNPMAKKRLAAMSGAGRGGPADADNEAWSDRPVAPAGTSPVQARPADVATPGGKTVDQLYEEMEGGECKGKPLRFVCQGALKSRLCKDYNAYGKPGSTICPMNEASQNI